jgi:hypothetical protein
VLRNFTGELLSARAKTLANNTMANNTYILEWLNQEYARAEKNSGIPDLLSVNMLHHEDAADISFAFPDLSKF